MIKSYYVYVSATPPACPLVAFSKEEMQRHMAGFAPNSTVLGDTGWFYFGAYSVVDRVGHVVGTLYHRELTAGDASALRAMLCP